MPSPIKTEQRTILNSITYSDGFGGTKTIQKNGMVLVFQSTTLQKNYRREPKRYYSAKEIRDVVIDEFQHHPTFKISTGTIKKYFDKGEYWSRHPQDTLVFRPGAVWVVTACFKPIAKNIFDAVEAMKKDLR